MNRVRAMLAEAAPHIVRTPSLEPTRKPGVGEKRLRSLIYPFGIIIYILSFVGHLGLTFLGPP